MSMINVSFDTVEKTITVTRDGNAIENFAGAEFYPEYDGSDFHCSIVQREKQDADDVLVYTRLVACESDAGKKLAAAGNVESKKLSGFIVADSKSQTEADIHEFFIASPKEDAKPRV